MPTETNDFNGEEYAIEFDQFDVSAEHTLSPENQETETGESDCDTSETVDAAGPAECIEPGMQAVIDQKGGKTHSWELQYRGDSGYFFDGEQARDPEGSVWTNEDIALHEEMLAQWKEGGSTVFFLPDYKEQAEDGEVLYVTMLMLGEDGRITYEIYSHEMKYHNGEEDSPLPIVEEAGTDIPATPWEEMDELPSELLAPEPISTIEAVFLESHESQEAEGSIVTLEPPISAPPAVERTQEPTFVDTVAETVFVDGTFVDAEPTYPAEDIRDAGATVVEAPQIAASESGIAEVNSAVPEIPVLNRHENDVRNDALGVLLKDLFKSELLESSDVPKPDSTTGRFDSAGLVFHEPVSNTPAPSTTSEAPALRSVFLAGDETHRDDIDDGTESQEAEGSIVTLEPPISAPPAVERTQEPMFVDTVAETVFVDGTFVDAEPTYPAEDIRDAGATVVEALQIAASESGIIDDPRDSVTDWMPEAVLVLKGVDQSSMEHRFDERERRTLPHGSEILVRALGIRIPSPRPIGRTHELMVSEIIQVSNSKSPRYSPPGASSYSHIVSTLDGITMRRTA